MAQERLLNQHRIDVVPAADDQLFAAPREPEIAFRILSSKIAGIQPLCSIDFNPKGPVVFLAQVSLKDVRATNDDGSNLSNTRRTDVFTIRIEHNQPHRLVGQAQSNGADAPFAGEGIDR